MKDINKSIVALERLLNNKKITDKMSPAKIYRIEDALKVLIIMRDNLKDV